MATVKTFVLHGKPTRIVEGDLLVSRSTSVTSYLLAAVNWGASHVTTAVNVGGELVAVGVLSHGWTDAAGVAHSPGITREPIELYNDPVYKNLWVVRPRAPRSAEAIARLRFAVAEQVRKDTGDGSIYDRSPSEFLHSACGMWPATTDHFHCAEWAAHLAKACGERAWPSGQTTSVSIHKLVQTVGDPVSIF